MIVTDEMVQKMTEELSLQFFNRPFLHRAYINKRLRTTGGRYLLDSHNIEVNEKYAIEYGEKELAGIIKHELCHYHLHLQGKGYKHGDADFKKLLAETNSPRYCRELPQQKALKKVRPILYYSCLQCGMVYRRKRKMDVNRYVCGSCRGRLAEIKR
ncbi:SprT family protein [Domibacillus epiphyticus]|uniref:Protein SprT-like n=1 Tax=Domibacillus epiphyticus TaxID=1714355 RepID=A0A1V2A746_9BACI|nr:SprT family protein [Domibacillus epiphyticus]OMP66809.1 SprT family protein [Domibacillus epiphyticus]